MKAAVCYGNGLVKYEEIQEPNVKENEVKVKIKACGICGSDIPRALKTSAHHYPIVLGHEAAGEIVGSGKEVSDLTIGDHVVILPLIPCMECDDCKKGNYSLCKKYSFIGSRQQGAMAEYVVVPKANVMKISKNIPFEQAALIEPATVSLHAFYQNNYQPNGTVAVIGDGTIGLFAMQWAKILGCKKVIVLGRDEELLNLAKDLGADVVINTSDKDFKEKALKETNNKGFDYIFEAVGAGVTIKYAFELAANKAHICLIGTPTSDVTFGNREWELINRKEFYLTGSWMSYSSGFPGQEWRFAEECLKDGRLKYDERLFYKKFAIENAQEAFNLFKDENRGNVKGRVLLTM